MLNNITVKKTKFRSIKEAAKFYRLELHAVYSRLQREWAIVRAFTTPIKKIKKSEFKKKYKKKGNHITLITAEGTKVNFESIKY